MYNIKVNMKRGMIMDTFKHIFSGWKLPLLIAFAVAVLLFAIFSSPFDTAQAIESYTISIPSQSGEYGNPLFANAEYDEEAGEAEVVRISRRYDLHNGRYFE